MLWGLDCHMHRLQMATSICSSLSCSSSPFRTHCYLKLALPAFLSMKDLPYEMFARNGCFQDWSVIILAFCLLLAAWEVLLYQSTQGYLIKFRDRVMVKLPESTFVPKKLLGL